MNGDIPARMLFEDETCVSFLDVRPLAPGHALVVPREEIDQWTDLSPATSTHLMAVPHRIGQAQKAVFAPARIGLMIAGFEVPHAHVHVVPMNSMAQLDFVNADESPDQDLLDQHLAALQEALAS